jgi:large subunit ribosomal protein L17
VFLDLAKRFRDRPGGYTRIIKLGRRRGDNAPMSLVEFVELADGGSGTPSKGKGKDKPKKGAAAAPKAEAEAETTAEKAAEKPKRAKKAPKTEGEET